MKKIFGIVVLLCVLSNFWAQEQEQSQKNERSFQFSFITPLGTNGMDSHMYTNEVSFNLLGGHSYANTAFEFGGLYNVNIGYTRGVQLAGLFNYTGESQGAAHFAGLLNIIRTGTPAFQFAGLVNVSGNIEGLQSAGLVNIGSNVEGFQAAGLVNVAKDTSGLQAASILNIAKNVKGLQLGLINYAEEIDGVPIGLINIVKNGGKREVEVSFSEALNTTVSFKLGTDYFYTIFSNGIRYLGDSFEYAPGLGFGTQLNWENGWSNQIEALAYVVTEDTEFVSDLNMLTQVKIVTAKTLVKGLNVFAGPTWNMTISQYKDKDGNLGSSLAPWSLWKNDSDTTRLNMWIGFTAGVSYRF